MRSLASFFKRLSSATEEQHEPMPANPSEVLRVHTEDFDGTLEIRNLDNPNEDPSKVLRISWIKRDDLKGVMKTVWITDEIALM